MARLRSSYSVNYLRICQIVSGFSSSSLTCDAWDVQLLRMPTRIWHARLFNFMHSNSCITMASHCVLIHICLTSNSIKDSFMCRFATCISFLKSMCSNHVPEFYSIIVALIEFCEFFIHSAYGPIRYIICKYVFPSLALSPLSLDSIFGENSLQFLKSSVLIVFCWSPSWHCI